MQFLFARAQYRRCVHCAETRREPAPDGGQRLVGNLLADDMTDDGGKQIRIQLPPDRSNRVDDCREPLVSRFQIRDFFFAVTKNIVPSSSLLQL